MGTPRVLLLFGQLPQDPTSGAPRTMLTIAEMLAESGFEVRALATTATEGGDTVDAKALLTELGVAVGEDVSGPGEVRRLLFERRGVLHRLLRVASPRADAWEARDGEAFDRAFDAQIAEFQPQLIFTYGGSMPMIRRWRRARAAGARVVFGLWNHGYLKSKRFFTEMDAVLTPSRFLRDRYCERLGVTSTSLPTPIDWNDVRAPSREAVFFTYVNPSRHKGVMFVARLAEEIGVRRPDIPLLIVESSAKAGSLVAAGMAGGFDLRRHENIIVTPRTPRPRDFFAVTRVLLVPSVWEEPSGRVASEALVNGLPAIVSDRGGLPEEIQQGGQVLPLPDNLTPASALPVDASAIERWIKAIEQLADDETAYESACALSVKAAERYDPERLRAKYAEFFRSVLDKPAR